MAEVRDIYPIHPHVRPSKKKTFILIFSSYHFLVTFRITSRCVLLFNIYCLSLQIPHSHEGYNGLPSLISSGLDDSLSDVGAKRKYPFELEKAIHNVMFIQHHMQRQDEFNAVSVMQDKKNSIEKRQEFKCKLPFFFASTPKGISLPHFIIIVIILRHLMSLP